MRRDWYSSTAIEFAKMEGITDSMIRENSRGEVTRLEPEDADEHDRAGTPLDPDIFGKFSEENPDAFGHIELPFGVVNIQYTRGRKSELPALLKLPLKKLEKIIYNSCYIRKGDDWKNGITIYTEAEKRNFIQANENEAGSGFKIGAEAIEELLAWKEIPADKYVLHCVPVMPICMRYFKYYDQERQENLYSPSTLNWTYNRLLIRIGRIERLKELRMPFIIQLNETRLLQETVDALISNGLRGIPKMDRGYPIDSLDELYRYTTALITNPKPDLSKLAATELPEKAIWKKLSEYRAICAQSQEDEDFDPTTEEMEKLDEIREQIYDLAKPIVEQTLREYYSQYDEAYKDIKWLTDAVIGDVIMDWTPEAGKLATKLAGPLYKTLELYFRKQFAWKGSAEN